MNVRIAGLLFLGFGILGVTSAAQAQLQTQTTVCQATVSYGTYCSDGTPSTTASNGYNSLPSWTNVNKALTQVTVADDQVWGVDSSNVLWELSNFKTSTTWLKVASGVTQIAAKHNLLCELNTNTHVYCTQSPVPATMANANGYYPVTFTDVGATTYTQIAASAGTQFWAVDANHNLWQVKDYTNPGTTSLMVAAGANLVAVDGRGTLCETDTSANVYCNSWPVPPSTVDGSGYHSLSGWVSTGAQLQTLAVADGKVYGTDSNGNVWLLPDFATSSTWEMIAYGGVGDKIAGGSLPSVWTPSAFSAGDVALMVFMGQSNSTGINSVPARFIAPSSPNVWGVTNGGWNYLTGNANGTTPFTSAVSTIASSAITWSNWQVQSSGADMNLGFNTSASGSAANVTAFQWQQLINAGWKLPDLYAIHIGWASQGVDAADTISGSSAAWVAHGVNLWQPLLTNTNQPSYALAPFSRRILSLALANLIASGKKPRFIGMQWNQWEAEAGNTNTVSITDAPANYANLFNAFESVVGQQFPVQFIKPLSTAYGATPLSQMQSVFANLVSGNPNYYSELDVSTVSSTIYSGGVFGGGDGAVHYNIDTHMWFSQQAIGACLTSGNCGPRITSVPTAATN